MIPIIFGVSGAQLSAEERAFFRSAGPAGYILFKHNIVDRDQVRALTDDLRELTGRDNLPILIDQEGGSVARMMPPIWPEFPSAAAFDTLYEIAPMSAIEAARCNAKAIALSLYEVGITVNCMPVLDLRHAATHIAIGDRTLGSDPLRVASLGRAALNGLQSGGVTGVIKHMPGQGRATLDSHHHLPRVDASDAALSKDLEPFIHLNDARIGMTGHVVFSEWDAVHPATMSPTIIGDIIRNRIGFEGLLLSDDLHMEALVGDIVTRVVDCLAAGCDIALSCWARGDDMERIAATLPEISDVTAARLAAADIGFLADEEPIADLIARRDALLAYV